MADRNDLAPSLTNLLESTDSVLAMHSADVGMSRESSRRRRWIRMTVVVLAVAAFVSWRASTATGIVPIPHIDPMQLTAMIFFALLIVMIAGQQLMSGRSPHITYRPEQIK